MTPQELVNYLKETNTKNNPIEIKEESAQDLIEQC